MLWLGRRSRPSALLQGRWGRRGRDLPIGFCRSALGRDGFGGEGGRGRGGAYGGGRAAGGGLGRLVCVGAKLGAMGWRGRRSRDPRRSRLNSSPQCKTSMPSSSLNKK